MKRALCLAGTFFATTAALRGFPSAAAEFEESRMAENDAAVVPVPSTEQRLHQPSPHNRNLFHQSSPSSSSNNRHLANGSNSTFRNLVLLLRFSDHSSRSLPSQSDVSELYNSVLPTTSGANADIAPTGSVRQVFLENSYGQFTIETTVTDWITLPHTEAYYAAGNHGFTMLKEGIIYALNYLENDPFFSYSIFDVDDDGNIDGLGVLTSGFGAEFAGIDCYGSENNYRIWSHKGSGLNWSSQELHNSDPINVNRYYVSSALRGKCGSDIVRMGVICHELGHYLGLPDLYDPSFSGVGIGAYDFMSQSWGFDGSGLYPPFLSAWSKVEVGWAKVVEIIHDGTFDIEASWKSSIVYKLSAGFPEGEYLLIENRQPYSYDEKLPGIGGLAIWHIDDNAKSQDNAGYPDMEETSTGYFPENSYHYQIALLSADGNYDLEMGINQGDSGDLWSASSSRRELTPGPNVFPNTDAYQDGIIVSSGIKIFNLSASGEKMSFSVKGVKSSVSQITNTSPSSPEPTTNAPTSQTPTSPLPTSNPTLPPTPSPVTSRPTSSPITVADLCADRCLIPIDESECPNELYLSSLPKCTEVDQVGSQCDADGECGTSEYLNNCAGYDIYRRVDCTTLDMTSNIYIVGDPTSSNCDVGNMTNWFTSVSLSSDPAHEASSEITLETLKPTTQPTNEAVVITGSLGSLTTSSNGQGCPYYPGTSQGHKYCVNDCKQPDYMIGSEIFEFTTIHNCCQLHFDDKEQCISQSLMVTNSDKSDVEAQHIPSISGKVWLDENANDKKGLNETGVSGVLIEIYDCQTKKLVERQITKYNGVYSFVDLLEGSYYLSIDLGGEFTLSEHNQKRNGNLDSDFKTTDGTTACYLVRLGGNNIKLDAGLIPIPYEAQLVSAQQQVFVSTSTPTQESAASVQSYATHTKSSQRTGGIQQDVNSSALQSKSMLRGSNFIEVDKIGVPNHYP